MSDSREPQDDGEKQQDQKEVNDPLTRGDVDAPRESFAEGQPEGEGSET